MYYAAAVDRLSPNFSPIRAAGRPAARALLLASLTACVARPPAPEIIAPAAAPAGFPAARYEQAAARGEPVYSIDASTSLVTVFVGRAGALSGMGHDHLIASRELRGFARCVRPAGGACGALEADAYAALATMTVDEPELRAEAGLEPAVPTDARAGTRSNMLKSLEAERFPFVHVHVAADLTATDAGNPASDVVISVTLHGVTRTLSGSAALRRPGGALEAEGSFTIRQTDFGIKPYAVLGGALAVDDELSVRFRVRAVRI